MNSTELKSWLSLYFRAKFNKDEAQFSCPRCSHSRFYFNTTKLIGYCQKASCHFSPSLKDLISLVGHGPSESLVTDSKPIQNVLSEDQEIALPQGARKLVDLHKGQFISSYPIAVNKVKERGVSIEDQYRFNLHIGNSRVYIPVYFKEKLVSYVGRAIWWLPFPSAKRYEYPKGSKVNNYLFNWDEAKTWTQLTLVENTFNGIWLHSSCVTSNFGSHLSDRQISLISSGKSAQKGSIVLLWDEGAEHGAERAVRKLRGLGFDAAYIKIKGQPDDYKKEELLGFINEGHERAKEGKIFYES